MNCPSCGVLNDEGKKFCTACGTILGRPCPSCGAALSGTESFCGDCGAPLAADAAPPKAVEPPVPAPAAERRLVSVLFADLVGFTSASERRDAEETRELLSRYFDTCRRLIELYGGTVEKFIGDAVMAVWGTPVATEDDAERAVRAALDLVAAVSSLGDEVGAEGLRARAGVLTGEAAVTIGAEGEGMVAGDLVNTASRIQSIALPGTVYVGDAARRATEQTITYEDAGSHELEGKGGLFPLYRALRVVSGARGSLKAEGLEPPFVGRDRELRMIKDLFHRSVDDEMAHLASIIGIAGIGKSRLAWEFFKYIDGIEQTTYWHRGRCLSYGEGVTYWALADMVRMRCRISEDEQPGAALEKLQAVLVEHVLDDEERRFVEPRVAHLLGLEERTSYERDDLFAAWRVFFERLAAVNPVSMIFEDMQWADDSLLDFIDYLLEWSRAHPIFVCTLARPEIHERRPTWGAAQRSFTSLYLEPLAQPAMEQLLDGLVPGLPEELRAQILERAEGVPLYAVETVRMMLDRGALVQDGPVYRPVGPIASLEVPETLHALIAARLDGLESEERRVLQDAAVLGKSFTRQALATLAGLDDAELEPLLRALTRKEILSVQADPRSPEHGQYSFVQDLLRHVAYETLSKHDRRMRHLAAARHLESAFADEDEIVEVVASHYLEAFRSAPDASDSAEIKIKAREMLTRAGDRAASLAAAREGQRYFEQAAELADDAVTCADLQDRAGQMAWRRGRAEEARELLDQAHGTFEQAREAKRAAAVSGRLADIDYHEGHPGDAVERLERALGTLSGPDADDEAARATAQLGRYLVLIGQTEEAAPHLERALTLAEGLGLDETFAQALNSKSLILLRKSRFREARILLEAAIATAEEADLPSAEARALNNLAVVNESTDRYVDALATTDRAVELLQRTGDRVAQKALWAGSISTLVLLGRWDEALERFAEVQRGELGSVGDAGQHLWIVQIACWRGDLVEAKRQVEGVPNPETVGDPQERTTVLVHLAMLERMDGNPRAALERIDRALPQSLDELGISFLTVKLMVVEALETAFALGDRSKVEELLALVERFRPGERPPLLNAHAARFRALLAAPEPSAERHFASAAQIFDDHGLVFWLAVTQLEHAEWLVGQDRGAEAERLLDEARETFERLEAAPWVRRLEAVASPERTEVPA